MGEKVPQAKSLFNYSNRINLICLISHFMFALSLSLNQSEKAFLASFNPENLDIEVFVHPINKLILIKALKKF